MLLPAVAVVALSAAFAAGAATGVLMPEQRSEQQQAADVARQSLQVADVESFKYRPALVDGVDVLAGDKVVSSSARVPAGKKLTLVDVPAGSDVTVTHVASGRDVTLAETPAGHLRTERLSPESTFDVSVTAVDGSSQSWQVRTRAPKQSFTASIFPSSSATYGVAVPVKVTFSQPVENKRQVSEALTVQADNPLGPVRWKWLSDTEAIARPKGFWPARTNFTVKADLSGVQASDNVWGQNSSGSFSTGRDTRVLTDFSTHTMVVKVDGKKKATFPISGGKSGWETMNGVKPISEKYDVKRLYNPDPVNGWDVMSQWALRLTYSGEFVHSAPWNYSIGAANTSHGCTNMTVADAKSLYDMVRVGDPVVSSGGLGQAAEWDTWGGAWSSSWEDFSQVSFPGTVALVGS